MKELLELIYLLNVFTECSKRFHPTVNRSYESEPELYSQGCFGQDPIGPLTLQLDAGNVVCRPHVYCIVLAVRFTRAFVSYLPRRLLSHAQNTQVRN